MGAPCESAVIIDAATDCATVADYADATAIDGLAAAAGDVAATIVDQGDIASVSNGINSTAGGAVPVPLLKPMVPPVSVIVPMVPLLVIVPMLAP